MSLDLALRNRFTDGALDTASGPRVVTMAYDRLDRDLAGAVEAIDGGDVQRAHQLLCHAQDLVHELQCMLDLDAWEHAPALAAIYQFVSDLLATANVHKRTLEATQARAMLAELGDAFRQAAISAGSGNAAAATRSASSPVAGSGFTSVSDGGGGQRRELSLRA